MPTLPSSFIVYILSSSHGGSTLLSVLLGIQPGFENLGETDAFSAEGKRARPLEDRKCSCGAANWKQCPFWSAVDAVMRRPGGRTLEELDLSSPDFQRFKDDHSAFWQAIFETSDARAWVDASKNIEGFQFLRRMGLPVVPIYLVRRPQGVVFSEIKKGRNFIAETFGYLHYHMRARLALRGQPHIRINYRKLALEPAQTISEILDFFEQPTQTPGLDWKSKTMHVLRGNKMMRQTDTAIHYDEQWRIGLSLFQKIVIVLITLPLRGNWYGFYAGYLKLHGWVRPLVRGKD